jgi:hypothetical protein
MRAAVLALLTGLMTSPALQRSTAWAEPRPLADNEAGLGEGPARRGGKMPGEPPGGGAAEPSNCRLPAAGAHDDVVLFGAYEGDALSTATVAGQDEVTTTARVVVEPGATPLYLILSSYKAVIWRFEGEVARMTRVVLVGPREQGVVGVERGKVVDLTKDVASLTEVPCFRPYYESRSVEAVIARGVVERALGQAPKMMGGEYELASVRIPSGVASRTERGSSPPAPAGFDATTYASHLRFNSGGVVTIDPKAVVSAAKPERYDVLPEHAGLAQLVGSGQLEPVGDSHGDFWIVKPIRRFPAGLNGSLSVRFVLGKGISLPPGSPGHSCVIAEETGRPVANAMTCGVR